MSAKAKKGTELTKQTKVNGARNAASSSVKVQGATRKARLPKPLLETAVNIPVPQDKFAQDDAAEATLVALAPLTDVLNEDVEDIPNEVLDGAVADERLGVIEAPADDSAIVADTAPVAAEKATSAQSREERKIERQRATEAKQTAKAALTERYHIAAAEVGRLRKEFLAALDEKAGLLGVERIGEAVPIRSEEVRSIDTEIVQARKHLEELLTKKKQLKGSSPELDAVNRRINDLRRMREAARAEKQAALAESNAHLSEKAVGA